MLNKIKIFLQKYSKREFRPSSIFNIPIYFYRLFLSIKSGSFLFFSNVNPGMKFSGFAGYGKYDGLKKFNPELIPQTLLFSPKSKLKTILKKIEEKNMQYPLIAKPDLGRTGRDIKKINNANDLKKYISNIKENFLIQEFIDYPLEFGIFYYRIPGEARGHITGIVKKTFMFTKGDGKSTLEELILRHSRAKYYYNSLKKTYKNSRNSIPKEGEDIQLNYIGNHIRGSVFYDSSILITPKLEEIIDNISRQIDGFYFGRYDIKVKNMEELYKGNFKILELNGIGSLPMHVYDPKYSLLKARNCLFKHRKITYKISRINLKNGYKYISIKDAYKIIKKYGI